MRVCPVPGCPTLVDKGKCSAHRREVEQARGSSTARGYDYAHQHERATWTPKVETGTVQCRRCPRLIDANAPWDLGHPDADCPKPTAPEHRACNRAVQGR